MIYRKVAVRNARCRTLRVYNNGGGRHEPTYIFADCRCGLWTDRSRSRAPNRFGLVLHGSRLFRPNVGKRARRCHHGLILRMRAFGGRGGPGQRCEFLETALGGTASWPRSKVSARYNLAGGGSHEDANDHCCGGRVALDGCSCAVAGGKGSNRHLGNHWHDLRRLCRHGAVCTGSSEGC